MNFNVFSEFAFVLARFALKFCRSFPSNFIWCRLSASNDHVCKNIHILLHGWQVLRANEHEQLRLMTDSVNCYNILNRWPLFQHKEFPSFFVISVAFFHLSIQIRARSRNVSHFSWLCGHISYQTHSNRNTLVCYTYYVPRNANSSMRHLRKKKQNEERKFEERKKKHESQQNFCLNL